VAVAKAFPGDAGDRQPVHTVYMGAHLFAADSAQRLGAQAIAALEECAPSPAIFAKALGLRTDDGFAETIRARVMGKLRREAVEDLRLDFEDGYGNRADGEEDGHAQSAAELVAAGMTAGTLPPFIGIRIKPLSKELHGRSLRTTDIFVSALIRAGGRLPDNFVITIPKVMAPAHVAAVAKTCALLEKKLKLKTGTLKLELMIETPQSILAPDGTSVLRALVAAGGGRVRAAHFGTYDYTALCGITASWQHMRHQVCDFAKHMMQVSLAQTGVFLSDGSTNVMPVGPHKAAGGGRLTDPQRRANAEAVHRAWKIHFDDITHSLVGGFYQGWDLHPAQLPSRYAAVYSFYLSARLAATARMKNFVQKATQATLVGDVFDDAATGQALLNFFARALSSGAITLEEAKETGLTEQELRGRSFLAILDARKTKQ
jgi:citrate lyase beta subunit